jgi:hypothetical protein
MADVERRDEHADHAWAELTWRKLAGFVFKYGFIPGFMCGLGALGIFVWTNWYQLFLLQAKAAFLEFWYLFAGFGLLAIGYISVNHWANKRKR